MQDKEFINELSNIMAAGVVVDAFATSRENVKMLILRQVCKALLAYYQGKMGKSYDSDLSMKMDAVTQVIDWVGEIKDAKERPT